MITLRKILLVRGTFATKGHDIFSGLLRGEGYNRQTVDTTPLISAMMVTDSAWTNVSRSGPV